MTLGSSRTAAGAPSASLRPKSSTTTLSDMRMTRPMWCSTSSTVRAPAQGALLAAHRRWPQRGGGEPAPAGVLAAEHHVLAHGERAVHAEMLEGSGDAELGDPVGREGQQV